MYGLEVIFLPEVVKIFSQINISVIFTHAFKIKSFTNICMWIITQIKGMLVLISSLKLSTVPYVAGSESRSHSRTAYMAIYRCQTASQVSLLVGFLISWISLPTKTGTPWIKVISQYIIYLREFYQLYLLIQNVQLYCDSQI